jgi:hypothetical protein
MRKASGDAGMKPMRSDRKVHPVTKSSVSGAMTEASGRVEMAPRSGGAEHRRRVGDVGLGIVSAAWQYKKRAPMTEVCSGDECQLRTLGEEPRGHLRVSPLPPPAARIAAWCACLDESFEMRISCG